MSSDTPPVIHRLVEAENSHDPDKVAACVSEDYEKMVPADPQQNYVGRDRVRANWADLFDSIPDFESKLIRATTQDDIVWTEWHMTGTTVDGDSVDRRGVNLFGIEDDLIQWSRIYLSDVEPNNED